MDRDRHPVPVERRLFAMLAAVVVGCAVAGGGTLATIAVLNTLKVAGCTGVVIGVATMAFMLFAGFGSAVWVLGRLTGHAPAGGGKSGVCPVCSGPIGRTEPGERCPHCGVPVRDEQAGG